MPIEFTKMHGLGNDFVIVDLFNQQVPDPVELAKAISDRHRGVGSDGLILMAPPEAPDANVRMIVYNADGSRAQMCGNGIRCLGKLAHERGLVRLNPLRVETDRGVLSLDLMFDEHGHVCGARVDMGAPILEPDCIPVKLPGPRVVDHPMPLGPLELRMTCVSMGNPHAVLFVRDLARVPLADWGQQIERHPLFPARINVNFVQVLGHDRVAVATWERGSGATQACGTGASAACVAGVLNGLTDRQVAVQLPGGELALEWDESTNHVFMAGPAVEVFTGWWPD